MPIQSITAWPADERPREKLIQKGPASLSDAELLAIFLRTGVAGKTAVDVARQLMNHFGSLRALFNADFGEFPAAVGIGPAKYAQLKAVLEMGQRYLGEAFRPGSELTSPLDTRHYLSAMLRGRPHEVFCCLFLDNRHRVLAFEELFRGTLNGAAVYPREVVKRAITLNAAAVILVHNHPSGVAEPSRADELLTQRLCEALGTIDIRVLDHFIVGEGRMTSFSERGLI
jgi:DNA repair protein RadC